MSRVRRVSLLTHTETRDTAAAVRRVIEVLAGAGVEVAVSAEEADKHRLGGADGVSV